MLFSLALCALLLYAELVKRQAMAERGHEMMASREAAFACAATLLLAALLLLGAAVASRIRVFNHSQGPWRIMKRCALGAALTLGLSTILALFVEGELAVLLIAVLCAPALLLTLFTRAAITTLDQMGQDDTPDTT